MAYWEKPTFWLRRADRRGDTICQLPGFAAPVELDGMLGWSLLLGFILRLIVTTKKGQVDESKIVENKKALLSFSTPTLIPEIKRSRGGEKIEAGKGESLTFFDLRLITKKEDKRDEKNIQARKDRALTVFWT